ncbi:phosphatidate cytidylyltransferase [Luteimonas sp. TWI414]|uniref:phosphatidate cytidylyltransferase n=3 Tax=Luteimonas TaxID=83614 RepID=UPI0032078A88
MSMNKTPHVHGAFCAAPERMSRRDFLPRLGTCLVIGPLAVGGILWLEARVLCIAAATVMLVVFNEWLIVSGIKARSAHRGVIALGGGLMAILASAPVEVLGGLAGAGALAWMGAPLWLARPNLGRTANGCSTAMKVGLGLLIVLSAFSAFHWLLDRYNGRHLILYILAVVCVLDSTAYLVGRYSNGFTAARLIAPNASPNKNYGVLVCAILASALAASLGAALLYPKLGPERALFFGLGMMAAASGVVGDLTSSLLKRHAGRKDSGSILPGHGGALDRLDSLVAALPVFAVALCLAFPAGEVSP